jgi:HD-GYP domain-containing protein (c-di-GMP phosphodiesterase class II)
MNHDAEAVRGQLLAFAEDIRELYREERKRARDLERALEELNESYLSTMETLAILVETKDVGTRQHLDRTREYALALTRTIDPTLAERPETAHGFLLHDIGKVGIPDRILGKRGPLTRPEWAIMRTHPIVGAQIVTPIRFLGDAVDVIRYHHERFDGTGYPHGLAGKQIPLLARIFSVVDAYDAIITDRPYRKAQSREWAIDEIVSSSGTHFDPEVVEAFLILMEDEVLPTFDGHTAAEQSAH